MHYKYQIDRKKLYKRIKKRFYTNSNNIADASTYGYLTFTSLLKYAYTAWYMLCRSNLDSNIHVDNINNYGLRPVITFYVCL